MKITKLEDMLTESIADKYVELRLMLENDEVSDEELLAAMNAFQKVKQPEFNKVRRLVRVLRGARNVELDDVDEYLKKIGRSTPSREQYNEIMELVEKAVINNPKATLIVKNFDRAMDLYQKQKKGKIKVPKGNIKKFKEAGGGLIDKAKEGIRKFKFKPLPEEQQSLIKKFAKEFPREFTSLFARALEHRKYEPATMKLKGHLEKGDKKEYTLPQIVHAIKSWHDDDIGKGAAWFFANYHQDPMPFLRTFAKRMGVGLLSGQKLPDKKKASAPGSKRVAIGSIPKSWLDKNIKGEIDSVLSRINAQSVAEEHEYDGLFILKEGQILLFDDILILEDEEPLESASPVTYKYVLPAMAGGQNRILSIEYTTGGVDVDIDDKPVARERWNVAFNVSGNSSEERKLKAAKMVKNAIVKSTKEALKRALSKLDVHPTELEEPQELAPEEPAEIAQNYPENEGWEEVEGPIDPDTKDEYETKVDLESGNTYRRRKDFGREVPQELEPESEDWEDPQEPEFEPVDDEQEAAALAGDETEEPGLPEIEKQIADKFKKNLSDKEVGEILKDLDNRHSDVLEAIFDDTADERTKQAMVVHLKKSGMGEDQIEELFGDKLTPSDSPKKKVNPALEDFTDKIKNEDFDSASKYYDAMYSMLKGKLNDSPELKEQIATQTLDALGSVLEKHGVPRDAFYRVTPNKLKRLIKNLKDINSAGDLYNMMDHLKLLSKIDWDMIAELAIASDKQVDSDVDIPAEADPDIRFATQLNNLLKSDPDLAALNNRINQYASRIEDPEEAAVRAAETMNILGEFGGKQKKKIPEPLRPKLIKAFELIISSRNVSESTNHINSLLIESDLQLPKPTDMSVAPDLTGEEEETEKIRIKAPWKPHNMISLGELLSAGLVEKKRRVNEITISTILGRIARLLRDRHGIDTKKKFVQYLLKHADIPYGVRKRLAQIIEKGSHSWFGEGQSRLVDFETGDVPFEKSWTKGKPSPYSYYKPEKEAEMHGKLEKALYSGMDMRRYPHRFLSKLQHKFGLSEEEARALTKEANDLLDLADLKGFVDDGMIYLPDSAVRALIPEKYAHKMLFHLLKDYVEAGQNVSVVSDDSLAAMRLKKLGHSRSEPYVLEKEVLDLLPNLGEEEFDRFASVFEENTGIPVIPQEVQGKWQEKAKEIHQRTSHIPEPDIDDIEDISELPQEPLELVKVTKDPVSRKVIDKKPNEEGIINAMKMIDDEDDKEKIGSILMSIFNKIDEGEDWDEDVEDIEHILRKHVPEVFERQKLEKTADAGAGKWPEYKEEPPTFMDFDYDTVEKAAAAVGDLFGVPQGWADARPAGMKKKTRKEKRRELEKLRGIIDSGSKKQKKSALESLVELEKEMGVEPTKKKKSSGLNLDHLKKLSGQEGVEEQPKTASDHIKNLRNKYTKKKKKKQKDSGAFDIEALKKLGGIDESRLNKVFYED